MSSQTSQGCIWQCMHVECLGRADSRQPSCHEATLPSFTYLVVKILHHSSGQGKAFVVAGTSACTTHTYTHMQNNIIKLAAFSGCIESATCCSMADYVPTLCCMQHPSHMQVFLYCVACMHYPSPISSRMTRELRVALQRM